MKPEECPVHRAAMESHRTNATEPLIRKVGRSSVTAECDTCSLCQAALECVRLNGTNDPAIADAWARLWSSEFDP